MALLRVAVDSGCGHCHGPVMRNGDFEYVPIPDDSGQDSRTYGKTAGRLGSPLVDYFPEQRRDSMREVSIHFDPEFETFTYGDPTSPKAGLRYLQKDDLLVFYCGLQGYDFASEPALYLLGYFVVATAGYARDFAAAQLQAEFAKNWHVMHAGGIANLRRPDEPLVLVKGGPGSRLYTKAHCISESGRNCNGQSLKILSKQMQQIVSDFNGHPSIQRSPTRWITDEPWLSRTAKFVSDLK